MCIDGLRTEPRSSCSKRVQSRGHSNRFLLAVFMQALRVSHSQGQCDDGNHWDVSAKPESFCSAAPIFPVVSHNTVFCLTSPQLHVAGRGVRRSGRLQRQQDGRRRVLHVQLQPGRAEKHEQHRCWMWKIPIALEKDRCGGRAAERPTRGR